MLSCTSSPEAESNFKVEYKGALKNIMRKGDISGVADLNDFQKSKNLYGLGALENLKGEILILRGKPYISSVNKRELIINNSFDCKATLFVYTQVEKWKTIEIPEDVNTCEDLEKYIEKTAKWL